MTGRFNEIESRRSRFWTAITVEQRALPMMDQIADNFDVDEIMIHTQELGAVFYGEYKDCSAIVSFIPAFGSKLLDARLVLVLGAVPDNAPAAILECLRERAEPFGITLRRFGPSISMALEVEPVESANDLRSAFEHMLLHHSKLKEMLSEMLSGVLAEQGMHAPMNTETRDPGETLH